MKKMAPKTQPKEAWVCPELLIFEDDPMKLPAYVRSHYSYYSSTLFGVSKAGDLISCLYALPYIVQYGPHVQGFSCLVFDGGVPDLEMCPRKPYYLR